MRTFENPAELLNAVGEDLGYSQWHDVTQEHIDLFAQATGDHQWIHTDPTRATAGPFGSTIAHGFLTLSMVSMMSWEVSTINNVSMLINYGMNKVRFPTPTPVGSRVRAHIVIDEVTETSKGIQVVQTVTVEIQGSDKPACVAQTVTLVVP